MEVTVKWIPMETRPPKDGKYLFVFREEWNGGIVKDHVEIGTYSVEFDDVKDDCHYINVDPDWMTAWAELPEPYKAVKSDG